MSSNLLDYWNTDWTEHLAEEFMRQMGTRQSWDSPIALAQHLDSGYIARPHLQYLSERLTAALHDVEAGQDRFLVISMPPRLGKALALDTPIPTPNGWKTMGDIEIGDQVFDENGDLCNVVGSNPIFRDRPCYEVAGRGWAVIADAAHEWPSMLPDSRSSAQGERRREWKMRETRALAGHRNKKACLMPTPALQLPHVVLPVDPYVLGAWLGDGSSKAPELTAGVEDLGFFREEFARLGLTLGKNRWRTERVATFRLAGVKHFLQQLGVWGDKRIPRSYLRASHEQRLALLQGIVDTDGHVNKYGTIEISLAKEDLLRDVSELVRSLGAVTSVQRAEKKQWGGFTMWRIQFRLPDAARLPRKVTRLRPANGKQDDLHRVTVTEVARRDTRCIEVDSPSHLYLAGEGMVPTHNTQSATIYFPTWLLHKHPDWPIMLISHSSDLAAGWGRQVRRLVEEHRELGVEIARDAGAAKDWETTDGGEIRSRSLGESIIGRGARVMVIDDPTKDFADAHSRHSRESLWEWWTGTARHRLHPPSLTVIILTRWHEDDIAGRLLSHEFDGDPTQWEVISLPALAEPGDLLGREVGEPLLSPLIPNETPEQALTRWADIRRGVGGYAWDALFQQRPSPAEGAIFNNDWWQFWRPGDLPTFDRVITSWDCAFKGTEVSDYVVGQLWGASGPNRYLLKQVRARLSFTETLEAIRSFAAAATDLVPHGVHEHIVEDKANGTAVIDVLRSQIPGMVPVNPTTSKEARARSVTPQIESGNVFLPQDAPWLNDFLSEVRAFPNSSSDDQVDALSQALTRLQSAGSVTPLVPRANVTRGFQRGGGVARAVSSGRRRA